jgi:hypothetical protein
MLISRLISTIRIIVACLIMTMIPVIALSQINVIHIADAREASGKDGVYYALPRTVFQVSIKVNKIQSVKGPYAAYANKYLGLSNSITSNSTEYEIKEISIALASEPDPDQYYFVETGNKSSKGNNQIEIKLSQSGILQDARDVSEIKNPKVTVNEQETRSEFADILNPSWFERVDTIIRRLSVDTTTIEQKVFRKASSEKTEEQKAKDAADYILKLDENKLNLLSGYQEIAYEKASIEYMCNQLDKLKSEYLALFQGLTTTSTIETTYNFVPKAGEPEQTAMLCKFSKMKGITEHSGQGDPLTIVVEALGMTKPVSGYLKTQSKYEKRSHGFYYCMPDNAKVYINIGGLTKLETVLPVNQLGLILSAPSDNSSSLQLHSTGSLKSVILE